MPFAHSKTRIAVEVAVVVGVLALIVMGLVVGGRFAARRAVAALPESVDLQLGNAAAAVYDRQFERCEDATTTNAVRAVVDRLVTAGGLPAGRVRVTVVKSADVNAFALPGGPVYVLTGLLQSLESPDELAGVLGHELGHVVLRHHIRNLGRSVGLAVAMGLVFGDVDGFTGTLIEASGELATLAFSREQETEADDLGARLAAKAGYDPAALGRFFGRLGGPAVPELLRSHPTSDERQRALGALVPTLPRGEGGAGPTLEALKAGCR